jgi:DNA-binding LytR/AlgR family response regulator
MFVNILTANGSVHININHIVRVEKGNNSVKIILSDGEVVMTSFTLESTMSQIEKALKAS